jgi:hypothetical protein
MKPSSCSEPGRRAAFGLLASVLILHSASALAGSIFITGHDPVWHSNFGGNALGAKHLAETAIDYARNGSALPFLFVESKTVPVPGGNAHEAPFLNTSLKYTTAGEFVVMDAADLAGLANFRLALNAYSAIVVASDHGGMLSAAELSFLNGHSADVIDYLNAGGGLAAFSESNSTGMIGATPRFGFLPFLVASSDFNSPETGNVVTPFGAGLGLVNGDVNGNFSHNFFSSTGGMSPVDLYNGEKDKPLSLAFRGGVTTGGVPETASTAALLAGALVCLIAAARRLGSASVR